MQQGGHAAAVDRCAEERCNGNPFSKSLGDAAASDAATNVLTVLPHSPRSVSLAGCSA